MTQASLALAKAALLSAVLSPLTVSSAAADIDRTALMAQAFHVCSDAVLSEVEVVGRNVHVAFDERHPFTGAPLNRHEFYRQPADIHERAIRIPFQNSANFLESQLFSVGVRTVPDVFSGNIVIIAEHGGREEMESDDDTRAIITFQLDPETFEQTYRNQELYPSQRFYHATYQGTGLTEMVESIEHGIMGCFGGTYFDPSVTPSDGIYEIRAEEAAREIVPFDLARTEHMPRGDRGAYGFEANNDYLP